MLYVVGTFYPERGLITKFVLCVFQITMEANFLLINAQVHCISE